MVMVMMDQSLGLQVLAVAFALVVCSVRCVRFDLGSSSTKCVSEEIQNDVLVLGDYHVVQENHPHDDIPKIFAQVTSPYGSTLHFAENVAEGHFGFTSKESGTYMACFWASQAYSKHDISVDFELKTGVSARDWNSIAKKEKLEGMELELRKLEDAVESIREEMLYLRDREAEMRNTNEVTNARVAWFSITSLFICLAVAGWQLWHLKSFFERKKLL